jgi:hypothetical protein
MSGWMRGKKAETPVFALRALRAIHKSFNAEESHRFRASALVRCRSLLIVVVRCTNRIGANPEIGTPSFMHR